MSITVQQSVGSFFDHEDKIKMPSTRKKEDFFITKYNNQLVKQKKGFKFEAPSHIVVVGILE
jgi:hypothetical protein